MQMLMKNYDRVWWKNLMKKFDENLWKSLMKTSVWWKFMDKFGEKLMNKKILWSKNDEKLIKFDEKGLWKLKFEREGRYQQNLSQLFFWHGCLI
jgi:hypothetical protein